MQLPLGFFERSKMQKGAAICKGRSKLCEAM